MHAIVAKCETTVKTPQKNTIQIVTAIAAIYVGKSLVQAVCPSHVRNPTDFRIHRVSNNLKHTDISFRTDVKHGTPERYPTINTRSVKVEILNE